MRASLCTHPKVLRIASIVGESLDIGKVLTAGFHGALHEVVTRNVTRDITLASLMRVWCAANEHTEAGIWRNADLEMIDQIAEVPGFGQALVDVGWAIVDIGKQEVAFPNFLENNAPAKNGARSSAAERQRKYRERKAAERNSNGDVTRDVTRNAREEKRRSTPIVPSGFELFWQAWPRGERKQAKGKCCEAWIRGSFESSAQTILAHVESLKAGNSWKDGFVPAPLVYLNQRRWEGADSDASEKPQLKVAL